MKMEEKKTKKIKNNNKINMRAKADTKIITIMARVIETNRS